MPQPKYHVFVCANQRPPGHPKGSCGSVGAAEVKDRLVGLVDQNNLWGSVKISSSGCLGPCGYGPVMVVYPEGVWYKQVRPEDVDEIVQSHFKGGAPVERLKLDPMFI